MAFQCEILQMLGSLICIWTTWAGVCARSLSLFVSLLLSFCIAGLDDFMVKHTIHTVHCIIIHKIICNRIGIKRSLFAFVCELCSVIVCVCVCV